MGMMEPAEDALMKARCRLLIMSPWYGTMASLMEWKIDNDIKTLGVRMLSGGRVECRWSPRFVEAVAEANPSNYVVDLMSCFQHEIEHIVRLHIVRHGARDGDLANVAADMCVNGSESNPNISDLPMIPLFDKDGKKTGEAPPIYFPESGGPPKDSTYEEIYSWLDKNREKIFIEMSGGGLDSSNDKKPKPGQKVIKGTTVDDHGIWKDSEISDDEARQIVKDMVEQATKKAGSAPGHLKNAIEELQDPKVNWKYLLRQFCGRALGGKRLTYSRRNRRIDRFGLPGKSNHASVPLVVAVDVSSSVASSRLMLEQLFTEVEAMSHRFRITLALFDAKVQTVTRYHRGDWRKIPAKGGMGTSFVNLFKYLEENNLLSNVIIVLTDGEATFPVEPLGTNVMWAMTTDVEPPWGKHVKVELD